MKISIIFKKTIIISMTIFFLAVGTTWATVSSVEVENDEEESVASVPIEECLTLRKKLSNCYPSDSIVSGIADKLALLRDERNKYEECSQTFPTLGLLSWGEEGVKIFMPGTEELASGKAGKKKEAFEQMVSDKNIRVYDSDGTTQIAKFKTDDGDKIKVIKGVEKPIELEGSWFYAKIIHGKKVYEGWLKGSIKQYTYSM